MATDCIRCNDNVSSIMTKLRKFFENEGHECCMIIGDNTFKWCQKDVCPETTTQPGTIKKAQEEVELAAKLPDQGHTYLSFSESYPVKADCYRKDIAQKSQLYTLETLTDIVGYGPNKEVYSIYADGNRIGVKCGKSKVELTGNIYKTASVDPITGILVLLVDNDLVFINNETIHKVLVKCLGTPRQLLDCNGILWMVNDMLIDTENYVRNAQRLRYRDGSYTLEKVDLYAKFSSITKEHKSTISHATEDIAIGFSNCHNYHMIHNNKVIPIKLPPRSNGYTVKWNILKAGVVSTIIDSSSIFIEITHHLLDGTNKIVFFTDEEWVSKWSLLTIGDQVDFVTLPSILLVNEMIDSWNKHHTSANQCMGILLSPYSLDNIENAPGDIKAIVAAAEAIIPTINDKKLKRELKQVPWFFEGIMWQICQDIIAVKDADIHYIIHNK